jgi:hypothetical protein
MDIFILPPIQNTYKMSEPTLDYAFLDKYFRPEGVLYILVFTYVRTYTLKH